MAFRRFSTEVAEAVRQDHQQVAEQVAKVLAGKAYVSWASALGIAGASAAYVSYDHRTQLASVKETMATKMEVAQLQAQMIVQSKDIEILGKDVQLLKDGVKEILRKLDAKGK